VPMAEPTSAESVVPLRQNEGQDTTDDVEPHSRRPGERPLEPRMTA
jgi:hypothetical protein